MAVINPKILNAALADGIFEKPLSANQKKYLPPSILTTWRFISAIERAGDNGLDREQLASRLKINSNTVKIYCEWLFKSGLIDKDKRDQRREGRPNVVYFARSKS